MINDVISIFRCFNVFIKEVACYTDINVIIYDVSYKIILFYNIAKKK